VETPPRSPAFRALLDSRRGQKSELYARHVDADGVLSARRFGAVQDFVRGLGAHLYDRDGTEYLDCDAGAGVFALGRNHPRMREVMHELIDLDLPNLASRDTPLLAGLLAEALARRTSGTLSRAQFTNSGGETIDLAMRFARRLTGRPRFLSLQGDYHGLTYGALSITDTETGTLHHLAHAESRGKGGFGPMLPGCTFIPRNDVERLQGELAAGDVAALFVEPINGQVLQPLSAEFVAAAHRSCREQGTLIVSDEVFLGVGRTGRFFGGEHVGLEPDAIVLSKALSGGYVPVAAMLLREDVHQRFHGEPGAALLGSTFGYNDFGLAAALATLQVIDEEDLLARAEREGRRLVDGLRDLQKRYDMIADVRGFGLLVAIELRSPDSLLRRFSGRALARRGLLAHMAAMHLLAKYHVVASTSGRNNILRFHPPLTIAGEDIDRLLTAVEGLLHDLYRFPDGISRFLLGQLLRTARRR